MYYKLYKRKNQSTATHRLYRNGFVVPQSDTFNPLFILFKVKNRNLYYADVSFVLSMCSWASPAIRQSRTAPSFGWVNQQDIRGQKIELSMQSSLP